MESYDRQGPYVTATRYERFLQKEFKKPTRPDDHKDKAKKKSKIRTAPREVVAIDQHPTYNKDKGSWRKPTGHQIDQSVPKGFGATSGNGHWFPLHNMPGLDLRNYRTW